MINGESLRLNHFCLINSDFNRIFKWQDYQMLRVGISEDPQIKKDDREQKNYQIKL